MLRFLPLPFFPFANLCVAPICDQEMPSPVLTPLLGSQDLVFLAVPRPKWNPHLPRATGIFSFLGWVTYPDAFHRFPKNRNQADHLNCELFSLMAWKLIKQSRETAICFEVIYW